MHQEAERVSLSLSLSLVSIVSHSHTHSHGTFRTTIGSCCSDLIREWWGLRRRRGAGKVRKWSVLKAWTQAETRVGQGMHYGRARTSRMGWTRHAFKSMNFWMGLEWLALLDLPVIIFFIVMWAGSFKDGWEEQIWWVMLCQSKTRLRQPQEKKEKRAFPHLYVLGRWLRCAHLPLTRSWYPSTTEGGTEPFSFW